MKRALSIFATLAIILSLVAAPSAFAQGVTDTCEQIIYYEDGSSLTISIETVNTRATGVTKSKRATYAGKDGTIEWEAVLTGTYTYNGTTAVCTASNCSVTIHNSTWYLVSKSATKSKNTASATFVIGKKVLGVTVSKQTYDLTLTCDANGNFS